MVSFWWLCSRESGGTTATGVTQHGVFFVAVQQRIRRNHADRGMTQHGVFLVAVQQRIRRNHANRGVTQHGVFLVAVQQRIRRKGPRNRGVTQHGVFLVAVQLPWPLHCQLIAFANNLLVQSCHIVGAMVDRGRLSLPHVLGLLSLQDSSIATTPQHWGGVDLQQGSVCQTASWCSI